jgi:hypothetical protein
MVNINIEIPNELHKKIRIAAAINDTTIKDHIIKLLEKEMKK